MSRHPTPLWSLFACLFVVACGEKSSAVEPVDAGLPLFPDLPDASEAAPEDRVAVCDQAADGTPCGDEGQHCILGVCADNLCGDGVRAGDEQCDDGNDRDGDACPRDCLFDSVCRDGQKDEGEECDDGNRVNDDACSNSCLAVVCGNRRVDPGEECDDGNTADGDACSSTCRDIVCGNGRVDPGEFCDGLTGCSEEGQACNAGCSACAEDKCGKCIEQKCTSYMEVDVLPGCRTAISPIAMMSATPLVDDFITKCTALDDCVRKNPSCYLAAPGPPDLLGCFCGTVDVSTCQAANTATGVCSAYFGAATGIAEGEAFNAGVLGAMTDLTLPSGWAYYLASCRYSECPAECGY